MAYKSPPAPHPTGMRREEFEDRRRELGLNAAGFRTDGADPLKAEKEAMQSEMYRRADDHLPEGLGGTANAVNAENG